MTLAAPSHLPPMNLGAYNIQDSRGFGLLKEILAVQMGNYDIMLLIETRIPEVV